MLFRIAPIIAAILIYTAPAHALDMRTSVTVNPTETGFILRNRKILRTLTPGQHAKYPIVETGVTVPNLYIFKKEIELTTPLSNGTDCSIKAEVNYQLYDPETVVSSYLAAGHPIPEDRTISANDLPDLQALDGIEETIKAAVTQTSPDKAKDRAIETWLAGQNLDRTVHPDGTKLVDAHATHVSCSDPKPKHRIACGTFWSDLIAFNNTHNWRDESKNIRINTIPVTAREMLANDQTRIKVTPPKVTVTSDREISPSQVEHAIHIWMRIVVGRSPYDQIDALAQESSIVELKEIFKVRLKDVTLISVDFSESGHQTIAGYKTDCD